MPSLVKPRFFRATPYNASNSRPVLARTARSMDRPTRTLRSLQSGNDDGRADREDFFRYDGGRWLWDEERHLKERYRAFNVDEIQTIAAHSVGASKCTSMMKLAEGGFNRVFRLVMHNGKAVIVRMPYPNSGNGFHATASEVATMEFVSFYVDVKVFSL